MKFLKVILNRVVLLSLCFIIEILFILNIINNFSDSIYIDLFFRVVSFILVLISVRYSDHLTKDLPLIILLLLSPVLGGIFMLIIRISLFQNRYFKKLINIEYKSKDIINQDMNVISKLKKEEKLYYNQMKYISDNNYPVYFNNDFKYFFTGKEVYKEMLKKLKMAKKYIFIEYFIIDEGKMWNSILEILKEKASLNVDVRIIYDDIGCISTLPSNYKKYLEKFNIKCEVFNKLNPIFSLILNHRDHRKMLIIDGEIAFSGGINIADEYINEKERFGYWKDNGFMIKGSAVNSYTLMFLKSWNTFSKQKLKYNDYFIKSKEKYNNGFVVPYGTNPYLKELLGQNIYLNIINNAKDYVYISTPYLIIDSDMNTALQLAAKRGVDVRIITPGIPDKKMVFLITRSYYDNLIKSGVKIYEFKPGFIHSKIFLCDDICATVGTVNLDYRSLYLHFECGTYLYKINEIFDIKKDIINIIESSTIIKKIHINFVLYIWQLILRLIAPLM